MWYVIVTARSLLWLLLGLLSACLTLAAIFSPAWLVAPDRSYRHDNATLTYPMSVGVYTRCARPLRPLDSGCTLMAVRGLAAEPALYPTAWKASLVFVALGAAGMWAAAAAGVASACAHSCCRKSAVAVAGAAQAAAGVSCVLGGALHPLAWGAERVARLCGREASPFWPGECALGGGVALLAAGTALSFAAGCASVAAERATSSDRIQDELDEGKTLVCLP